MFNLIRLTRINKSRIRHNSRGAIIVEAAIIIPCFIFLILTLIDTCRYFSAKVVLTKGASDALNLAEKLNGTTTDINGVQQTSPEYQKFSSARQLIENRALTLPFASSIVSSDSDSWAKLIRYQVVDNLATNRTHQSDVLFLLPGASAQRIGADGSININSPIPCSQPGNTCSDDQKPNGSDTWSEK